MAGYIYSHEGNYERALRAVHVGLTLEQLALKTQTLLKLNRVELAERELADMGKMNEDATLTQVRRCGWCCWCWWCCCCWCCCSCACCCPCYWCPC